MNRKEFIKWRINCATRNEAKLENIEKNTQKRTKEDKQS